MATYKSKQLGFWIINIVSESSFLEEEKEIITQLFNEESWRYRKSGSMILDDMFESEQQCQLVVEANKTRIKNLVEAFRSNFIYTISVED